MRTYERTHPWLKFVLNLEVLPIGLWLLRGSEVEM